MYYAKDLPRPQDFSEVAFAQPTRLYDRTGEVLLYEIHGEERREPISLSEVPSFLPQAIIATEDQRFYSHYGVDLKGVARAVLYNLKILAPAQGASTISQQLVRTVLLTREQTIERKMRELILTLELERRYSKDEILELYLNQIPWGANAYGVGAASSLYFGKLAKDLSLEEAALLAAMIKAPTYYSPYGAHQEELLNRKNFVLNRMKDLGFLFPEQTEEAKAQDLSFADPAANIRAPHFVLQALDLLLAEYGEEFLRENGLRVLTTLDWRLQEAAQGAIDGFAKRNELFQAYNAALVALDPSTGEILALVGSKDWYGKAAPEGCVSGKDCLFDPKVNVAMYLQGRQPGSAFKPFVYATAFEKGASDETIVEDAETNFGIWGDEEYIPQNYDERFRGPVTLRQALAQSLNVPSVKVLLELAGLKDSIERAKELGITTLKDSSQYGPSLVLGGGEVHLLDMVAAYGVFASEGKKTYPQSILQIQDTKGRPLKENTSSAIQIMDPKIAILVTSILSDNEARAPVFGLYSKLLVPGYGVAAKTGTTQEYRDAWTLGYTSELAAGVWVGNNNNAAMEKAPGATVAAPIWNQFMTEALPLLTP